MDHLPETVGSIWWLRPYIFWLYCESIAFFVLSTCSFHLSSSGLLKVIVSCIYHSTQLVPQYGLTKKLY